MPKFHGLSLLGLLLVAPTAFGANVTDQKFQAFKAARADLAGKIDAFLQDVDACNPPVGMVKDQIMKGFGGTQPDSAKSLLAVEENNVSEHVALADKKLAAVEGAGASCSTKDQLLKQASDAGAEVQTNLASDAADLKKGMDEASHKKPLVIAALDLRQKGLNSPVPLPMAAGDVARCESAKAKVTEMEAANAAFARSLADLSASYSDRVTFETSALNAPSLCSGSSGLVHKTSFGGEPELEEAVPAEGNGTTAI